MKTIFTSPRLVKAFCAQFSQCKDAKALNDGSIKTLEELKQAYSTTVLLSSDNGPEDEEYCYITDLNKDSESLVLTEKELADLGYYLD